ncbi:hypothetical protein FB192DRAFT_1280573 [Mucor lusitanicus]|uniref:DUF7082 domain-containing protein n=2 Tax=Mucor circinelloides f. lusitanicus TaxID=29924 RepID=A0A8H4BJ76_MUCCL|nr:hypothetical protein FB192DRAFT_1280573 [Mucor lusitanicus]
MSEDQQQQQHLPQKSEGKGAQGPRLIELSPSGGIEGTIVTVVVQALPPQMPAKLAFNSLMVDTKQLQAQGITSLVATVPSFQQTHSSTPNVPISICFLDKDMVTETWTVADFNYTALNGGDKMSPSVTSSVTPAANAAHTTTSSNSAVFGFKSAVHTPTTSVANYQPYPGLVSRANLDIMGDLDAMAKSWAPEEWDHRRRLVQFWREQHGNKISTTFQPVPQGERASNSGNIVVSCIYWMERNDFFITSVDCIYLLECLMDIRFSVEEKNRIRRNLEGFRPLTVSKCKAESADFFKLIMSFPNPKPRNIEKDVKVFPWKTLPYALKKIVTKYTASSYNNVGSTHNSQKVQQTSAKQSPAPSATSTSSNVFYHQQDQDTAVSDRSTLVSSYNAQPYSHELYEPAYFNNQQQQQQPAECSNVDSSSASIVGGMRDIPSSTTAASDATSATVSTPHLDPTTAKNPLPNAASTTASPPTATDEKQETPSD